MRDEAARLARALEWIVRLPLCGDRELAGLMGVDEHDARRLIHLLAAQGWVETVAAASPELEPRRLAVLRGAAVPALAAACGRDLASLAGAVPARPRDLAGRLAALETSARVNRFLAELASDLESSGIARLDDARSLPLALPRSERWWLPGVEGYGCLRAGPLHAPFLVAWDRAAAPDVHRRRRLGDWFAASGSAGRRWGREGLPPVLLVCPSAREARVWEDALTRREEAGPVRLDVLLTTGDELHAAGAGEARWRRPGRAPAPLAEQLGWGEAPVVREVRIGPALDDCTPPLRRTGRSPGRSAFDRAASGHGGPVWQRLADLALATSAAEKTLVEWVARHPLLGAAELAELTREPAGAIRRRLERLASCGVIGADAQPPGRAAIPGAGDAGEPRYLLTELGMRLLAAHAGVPPATFARHGGVTVVPGPGRPRPRALRHREHTLGVNRVAARLARGARAAGWRLAQWRNEAESTHRFLAEDGRIAWIRPDASGVLVRGAAARPFLLEYDRGTLDSGDYHAKLEGYRRYYAAREWEGHFPREPALLFVCSDRRAEHRVRLAVDGWSDRVAVLVAAGWQCRDQCVELLGSVRGRRADDAHVKRDHRGDSGGAVEALAPARGSDGETGNAGSGSPGPRAGEPRGRRR
ncbi:MAG: replication-relaxation family protein [Chloroflexi bacterium]|nr:replication-relaxation family protein [Chloroflexota bacterium]